MEELKEGNKNPIWHITLHYFFPWHVVDSLGREVNEDEIGIANFETLEGTGDSVRHRGKIHLPLGEYVYPRLAFLKITERNMHAFWVWRRKKTPSL